ncbi:alpha/beta fold hydrolase|uniref:alpha/beta fold hydrolase n=1 Tax=Stenotrophomonas sp. SbOxS2 TaxID=2723885 RepID=UPI0015D2D62D|nr:alpha/beta fold hydrolase [Stenotrophomonas sp. SbOxS2]NYT99445.1 alpha/beta fold hydrolase [Stenotrophomonas sp. SbOxS2]
MSSSRPTFLLIHGAWHDSSTWSKVTPILESQGCRVSVLDLPGAGAHARAPEAYFQTPVDPGAFATEPSPNAGVSQDERNEAVIRAIDELGGEVVLVGHSLGGVTVAEVSESAPDRVRAAVYLAAFMLPKTFSVLDIVRHESMAQSQITSLLVADPSTVGALRVNPRSGDLDYLEKVRETLYADVEVTAMMEAVSHLHCDEPVSVFMAGARSTDKGFGRVPRHYIRTAQDRVVPLPAQDFMISSVDASVKSKTEVHTLDSGHSAFYSRPLELAQILVSVASN